MDCVGNREAADCKALWLLLPFQGRFFTVLEIRSFNRWFDLGRHCKQTELICAGSRLVEHWLPDLQSKMSCGLSHSVPAEHLAFRARQRSRPSGWDATAVLYLQDWRLSRWLDSKEKTQLYVKFSSKVEAPLNRRIDVSRTYCGLLLCLRVCVFSSLAGRTMSE